jgi:HTH-type transcriptional regulator/antitoxin MqsA
MLEHFEEERRREHAKSRRKPTGANLFGVLGPREVVKVREALGLSQCKAGELLGGGPRAFQKYESGEQAVSVPMSHLLRLLAHDPARLKELDASKGNSAPGRKSPQGRSSSGRAA